MTIANTLHSNAATSASTAAVPQNNKTASPVSLDNAHYNRQPYTYNAGKPMCSNKKKAQAQSKANTNTATTKTIPV